MDAVTVRPARLEDVPGVRRVARHGWRTAYEDILATDTIERALANWYDQASVERAIERDEGAFFIGEYNDQVTGYANGSPDSIPGVVSLAAIYVDPERWGGGIGTALLDTFNEFWQEREYTTVELHVLSANHIGRSFYEKHGFETLEVQETTIFGETVSEHILRSDLANGGVE